MTTKKAIGRFFIQSLPATRAAKATAPISNAISCVSPRCAMKYDERSQKSP